MLILGSGDTQERDVINRGDFNLQYDTIRYDLICYWVKFLNFGPKFLRWEFEEIWCL